MHARKQASKQVYKCPECLYCVIYRTLLNARPMEKNINDSNENYWKNKQERRTFTASDHILLSLSLSLFPFFTPHTSHRSLRSAFHLWIYFFFAAFHLWQLISFTVRFMPCWQLRYCPGIVIQLHSYTHITCVCVDVHGTVCHYWPRLIFHGKLESETQKRTLGQHNELLIWIKSRRVRVERKFMHRQCVARTAGSAFCWPTKNFLHACCDDTRRRRRYVVVATRLIPATLHDDRRHWKQKCHVDIYIFH